jgi:hypothetical protein
MLRLMVLLMIILVLCACEEDNPVDFSNPSNLVVEVLSIDQETGEAVIQASAQYAVQFQLFIGNAGTPVEVNETGFFRYTFSEEGQYTITVRAYGASGRYITALKVVTILAEEYDPVPLENGYFTPMEYEGYVLAWHDEFDGNSINPESWGYDIGDGCPNLCGWGNNELQYYRSENAWVADDVLTIEARQEDFMSRNYTSARLISKGKKSFRYGRIDIRALLPRGQGMWPALWMLGNDINTVGWPACGEIDIMEMIGGNNRENTCHGTIHWDNGQGHASYGTSFTLTSKTFAEAYHVFSIIWDEYSIKWYVDDQPYTQVNITEPTMSEFHQEFWFIMNIAVGGNWPGNPDGTTQFPQQMKVDYIRVFQKD